MTKLWTTEEKEMIRKLATEGRSASEIGRELGVTRNAVIGVMHRNKIPSWMHGAGFVRKPATPRPRTPRTIKVKTIKIPSFRSEPVREINLEVNKPSNENKSLMELGRFHCRAVIDYPYHQETMYCGRKTLDGKSWCHDHFAIYFRNDSQTTGGRVVQKAHTGNHRHFSQNGR